MVKLPRHSIQARVTEQVFSIWMRSDLLRLQSVRGRCTRVLQTVFVTAAKIKSYDCKDKEPFKSVMFSPFSELLTNRCISRPLRFKPNSGLLFLW